MNQSNNTFRVVNKIFNNDVKLDHGQSIEEP